MTIILFYKFCFDSVYKLWLIKHPTFILLAQTKLKIFVNYFEVQSAVLPNGTCQHLSKSLTSYVFYVRVLVFFFFIYFISYSIFSNAVLFSTRPVYLYKVIGIASWTTEKGKYAGHVQPNAVFIRVRFLYNGISNEILNNNGERLVPARRNRPPPLF